MIVGDPAVFAIESSISRAFRERGSLALGYFVVSIRGAVYGVRSAAATMLANSYDQVRERLARRGTHLVYFASDPAEVIAKNYRLTFYASDALKAKWPSSVSSSAFAEAMIEARILWAPDGDAAFDDGSYILQFDVENFVRLVAFKSTADPEQLYDQTTLVDLWLDSETFYRTLKQWLDGFESEYDAAAKEG